MVVILFEYLAAYVMISHVNVLYWLKKNMSLQLISAFGILEGSPAAPAVDGWI